MLVVCTFLNETYLNCIYYTIIVIKSHQVAGGKLDVKKAISRSDGGGGGGGRGGRGGRGGGGGGGGGGNRNNWGGNPRNDHWGGHHNSKYIFK